MNAGTFDRSIRVEYKVVSQNSTTGIKTATWTTLIAHLWANIQEVLPSKSGETAGDGIRIAERPARVRIPYVTGITAAMRIVYLDRSARVMKIMSPPVEIGRQEALEFMVADFSTSGEAS